MSEPSLEMGVAAPMLVAGAMAATWAARVRNVPALAARLPAGPTQTRTGICADELRLDDVAGGVERAARRVELDDDGSCPAGRRRRDAFPQVAGHDLVDDARRGQHDDAWLPLGLRAADQQRHDSHRAGSGSGRG